jgi:hypothetical protein
MKKAQVSLTPLNDAAVVSLGAMLKQDQSLVDLADLLEEWQASRETSWTPGSGEREADKTRPNRKSSADGDMRSALEEGRQAC